MIEQKNYGTLKIMCFMDISWRCIKTLIAVVVYLIVTSYQFLNLGTSNLKNNFVNN